MCTVLLPPAVNPIAVKNKEEDDDDDNNNNNNKGHRKLQESFNKLLHDISLHKKVSCALR
jgi:hypothetical protein